MNDPRGSAFVYSGGLLDEIHAKTAHGLLRYSDRFNILGVIDQKFDGCNTDELVTNCIKTIPIYTDFNTACQALDQKPDFLVIGVAFGGGKLPTEHRDVIIDALNNGVDVVCGLHEILGNDPEFNTLSIQNNAVIHDIRKPKTIDQLSFWSGKILSLETPRIAVLGSDCAVGKRTACQFLTNALNKQDVKTEVIYTGQTGFLQGFKHGFILDSTINDFVSGELEKAILECEKESKPDLMLIEGQSSLRNPSGPCGSELLLSADVQGVVLVHPFDRKYFDNFEEFKCVIPTLIEEIELIKNYGKETLGICINCNDENFNSEIIIQETGIPAINPIHQNISPIVETIKNTIL